MNTAIITGGSSGIGQALVVRLVRSGFRCSIVARNEKGLNATRDLLPHDLQKYLHPFVADLSNLEDVKKIVPETLSHFGCKSIDLLINNAGYGTTGFIEDIPGEAFERSLKVNFLSAVRLIQDVLPAMKFARTGLIANVSSGVALRALPFWAPYCSAKAALDSFSDSLRVEVEPFGIHVLNFSPGPVNSGFSGAKIHYGKSRLDYTPAFGKSPDAIADILMVAIHSRQKRVLLGRSAHLARHLQYWSPSLADKVVKRMVRIVASDHITSPST